eukprot:gene27-3423_t
MSAVSAAASRKGVRDEMQDTHVMLDDTSTMFDIPYAKTVRFYAVYDGHAGSNASKYCAQNLHYNLFDRLPTDVSEKGFGGRMKKCLTETFATTDRNFLQEAASQTPAWKDGCTAAAVVILDDVIYAANVGDTRSCVGRLENSDSIKPLLLSKVHVATQYEERQRIQKAGGALVFLVNITLVSRTIGDGRFKSIGASSQPHVIKCSLSPKDKFLLIACDGLWDHFSTDDAVQFVWSKLRESEKGDVLLDLNLAQTIANQLVNEAVHRGSDDNVSAIIVLFRFHGDETSSLARSKEATVADNLPPTENVPKSSHIPAEGCNGSTDSINTST